MRLPQGRGGNRQRATPQKTSAGSARRRLPIESSAEIDASRIKVDANGGTVTLSGNVRSWAEMKRAESAAWGAPGVRNVLNRIEIVS